MLLLNRQVAAWLIFAPIAPLCGNGVGALGADHLSAKRSRKRFRLARDAELNAEYCAARNQG